MTSDDHRDAATAGTATTQERRQLQRQSNDSNHNDAGMALTAATGDGSIAGGRWFISYLLL
jgi:hypothetical protein